MSDLSCLESIAPAILYVLTIQTENSDGLPLMLEVVPTVILITIIMCIICVTLQFMFSVCLLASHFPV
jgi:hypothetical protein